MTLKQAGALVGVVGRQWGRYEANDIGDGVFYAEKLEMIARETGTPAWFVLGGWEAEDRTPVLGERVEALEHKLDALTHAARTDSSVLLEQVLVALGPDVRRRLEESASGGGGQDRPDSASVDGGA